MAIQFARARVISPTGNKPRSAVAASAYNGRSVGIDHTTGERFDFRNRGADLVDSGFLLPSNAPEWAADMQRLWNEATEAEKVTDRKTKERRFSQNGSPQVARELVLALPKELTDEQNRDLALAYIMARHDGPGGQKVAIQWAIHRDPEGKNPHLHLMESTRELTGKGFGKKDRRLNPEFNKGQIVPDQLGSRWAEFQNTYFRERGFKLAVDPTRIVPDRHMNSALYIEESKRQEQRDQLERENREATRDPEKVLIHVTAHKATFSVQDIDRYLVKGGLDDAERLEVRSAILDRGDLVALAGERYTTQAILDQEQAVLGYADKLNTSGGFAVSRTVAQLATSSRTMDAEQMNAFDVATKANAIAIIQGRAGTGKSYTMGAIRDAYEAEGYRVVGLAPTNAVAADMRADGFKEGRTIASEMLRQQNEREVWDSRTVVVVDEMGMVSTRDMERMLARAEAAGAKVIGFGDDRQLQSVERGGMFPLLAEKAPSTELKSVRRQEMDWMREASEAAADGNISAAVKTYDERGNVLWSADLDKARAELVQDWKAATESTGDMPAVYASTNAQVHALNTEIRLARKELGQLGTMSHAFEVEKREDKRTILLSENDRIIFTSSVRDRATGLDLRNGEAGTVTKIEGSRITVRTDGASSRTFTFDGDENRGWDLGYASTVYKSQGKTKGQAWALHDSKFAWNSSTAYVGLTRHKNDFRLYANRDMAKNAQELGWRMSRKGDNGAASAFKRAEVAVPSLPAQRATATPVGVAEKLAALREQEAQRVADRERSAAQARMRDILNSLRESEYSMQQSLRFLEKKGAAIWDKAQRDNPDDIPAAQAQASKDLRREYNSEFNSRVWPATPTEHFRAHCDTFREASKVNEHQAPLKERNLMLEAEQRAEAKRAQEMAEGRISKPKDRGLGL